MSENELNVSDQSLVTHVRTPTHTFCVDEDSNFSGFHCRVSEIFLGNKPVPLGRMYTSEGSRKLRTPVPPKDDHNLLSSS